MVARTRESLPSRVTCSQGRSLMTNSTPAHLIFTKHWFYQTSSHRRQNSWVIAPASGSPVRASFPECVWPFLEDGKNVQAKRSRPYSHPTPPTARQHTPLHPPHRCRTISSPCFYCTPPLPSHLGQFSQFINFISNIFFWCCFKFWSERSGCAALGCWQKWRWPLF